MGTKTPSIGIYEADRTVSTVLGEILTAEGYHAEPVSPGALPDADAAAAMLAVLVDFPPDREGREEARQVINELRRLAAPHRLPVIGLTSDFDLLRRGGSRFEDVADFALLAKPFGLNDLTDLLAMMLARAGRGTVALPTAPHTAGIVYTDPAGRYTDANPAALAMLGYSLDELRRLSVADLLEATERATVQEWSRYRREGSWSGETVHLRRKDGEALVAEIHASVIQGDATNEPMHVAWIRPRPARADESQRS